MRWHARLSVLGAAFLLFWPTCTPTAAVAVSDADVDAGIDTAVKFLFNQQRHDGSWETDYGRSNWLKQYPGGRTALAVLALMASGESPHGQRIVNGVDWLIKQSLDRTYTVSLRAAVLSEMPQEQYRPRLVVDAKWLLNRLGADGTYTYPGGGAGGDHSNSQFGVLGVWSAALSGVKVPASYWNKVEKHWLGSQNSDGGWGYRPHERSYGSMTAAGLATLFIVQDQLLSRRRDRSDSQARLAIGWMDRNYSPTNPGNNGSWIYYYLYAMERAGLACGRKYFGTHNWFAEGADYLLRKQDRRGAWYERNAGNDPIVGTSMAVLFLSRGRAPIFFNKLNWGPGWDRTPRDVANLTRFMKQRFEQRVNWQVLQTDATLRDFHDAPVLYVTGRVAPTLNDEALTRIRKYVYSGGLLLGEAGNGSKSFVAEFKRICLSMFGQDLEPLAADHPVRNIHFTLGRSQPLLGISNGVRLLALLSPDDLSMAWQRRQTDRQEPAFQLAANIYIYATDASTLRHRLDSPVVHRNQKYHPQSKISMARLRYDGNWNPEPAAWRRFSDNLFNDTRIDLMVEDVGITDGSLSRHLLAHLTGTGEVEFTAEEVNALRSYVSGGGTILLDAAAGNLQWAKSVQLLFERLFPGRRGHLIKARHVMIKGLFPGGVDAREIAFRRSARQRIGLITSPEITAFNFEDPELGVRRPVVMFSRWDLTAALLGTPIYKCIGYDPDSAYRIARNIVLWVHHEQQNEQE